MLPAQEILALHRQLVAIKSLSHEEDEAGDFIADWLAARGAAVRRIGKNVVTTAGHGRRVLFNSHFDTVPPNANWTRDPWNVEVVDGKVFGLGSNDAKASAVAMMVAFAEVLENGGPCELTLLLAPEEETGGKGTEYAWPILREEGYAPEGVVVGEPTELNLAIAQKGILVLHLVAKGEACHSANAKALGACNPIRGLAKDLVALEAVKLGKAHPHLGEATWEPTVVKAGEARNQVPGEAHCWIDVRTVPPWLHEDYIAQFEVLLQHSELQIHSQRLQPIECDPCADIVKAAESARSKSRLFGSPTMSDMVYFRGTHCIKAGPGVSARSHTADEFVLESEILDGVEFYRALIHRFAAL